MEAGDRRWLAAFSPAEPAEISYYERLFDFLDEDGPAVVAQWLSERQIKLDPKGRAPMTSGKVEMRSMTLGDAEQYLTELMESGEAPFDFGLVRLDDVVSIVPDRIARHSRGLRNRIAKWLKDEVGAVKLSRYTKGNGRQAIQLWSIADHDNWQKMGPAACNDAYEQRLA
jgi:hypothetical protein